MYRNVKEIQPGAVNIMVAQPDSTRSRGEFRYWIPPQEVKDITKRESLVNEFVEYWPRAVRARCRGELPAIQLSGGMDSRLVLSAVPPAQDCVAVTLCDSMNREARYARSVAACYGRKWVTLKRDPEYLGKSLVESTRFTGCEGEFHHGHTIGFRAQLKEMGADSVFTGLFMDNNFKGYYAKDFVRVARGGGLLPATHRAVSLDYANQVSDFCRQFLKPECVEGTVERRRNFARDHFANTRESRWEWLDGYPLSQSCDNTGWTIERRVMPMRIPVMDRALVDLAFRVPMSFKAGGRFFERAAVRLLGPGRRIPNANDGVLPGSGHVSRLLQRGLRKAQRQARSVVSSLGVRLQVPHSWHDFGPYLQESVILTELIEQHGGQLRRIESSVFKDDPTRLIRNPSVPWAVGYRLIQLAVWRSLIEEYRAIRRTARLVAP